MENQNPINPPESNNVNPLAKQTISASIDKTNLLVPILFTFLISAFIFGIGGYYLGKMNSQSTNLNDVSKTKPSPLIAQINHSPTPNSKKYNVAEDWKIYSNPQTDFSFKYPQDLFLREETGNANTVSLYQSQALLNQAKNCTYYLGQENDPCPPPVLSISYREYSKSEITDATSLNGEVGGGMLDNTVEIEAADGKAWIVGQPLGLELRPGIRLYADAASSYQFAEIDMYLVGLWKYINETETQPTFEQSQTVWDQTDLVHSIISTFNTGE